MVDKAAIFTELTERNATRRAALLPPLDLPAAYRQAIMFAVWQEVLEAHAEAVQREVLTQLRRTHGADFPASAGGVWLLQGLTRVRLRSLFLRAMDQHKVAAGQTR